MSSGKHLTLPVTKPAESRDSDPTGHEPAGFAPAKRDRSAALKAVELRRRTSPIDRPDVVE